MKRSPLACGALLAALILLVGCTTRSISNSGFQASHHAAYKAAGYTGELSELEVIGVTATESVTEADIQEAVRSPAGTTLARNSRVLLIQSGAEFPDAPMLEALQPHFSVASFSGRPNAGLPPGAPFSRALRLAAARGGYDKILCYWGVLESERRDKITRLVSWVPIAGYVIPDEREHMRIKLKAAIIDVASGRWTFVNPPAANSSSLSTVLSREETDQALVHRLKAEGYRELARTLVEKHTS